MTISRFRALRFAAAALILAVVPVSGWCWGTTVHTLVTQRAIGLLPPELKPFYQKSERYIVAFSVLPDSWKQTHRLEERPNHYINLDILDQPPFTRVIGTKAAAEARFGSEALRNAGLLPWAIVGRYNRLVSAFKSGDTVEVAVQSALLCHYIADAHVSLHVTQFHDGKTPAEKGIHHRWEEALPAAMLKPEAVKPSAAASVGDILKSAFDWCAGSFNRANAIFQADDKARARDPRHGPAYYKVLYQYSGYVLKDQASRASSAVAGAWIAAWKQAGRPPIPGKCAPFFWSELE